MKRTLFLITVLLSCTLLTACFAPARPMPSDTSEQTALEDTEPAAPTVNQIIKSAELQYPASNEQFKYNVYDTYVEITEYIGGDTAELVVPATLDELPVLVVTYSFFDNKYAIDTVIFEDGIVQVNAYFSSGKIKKVVLPSTLNGTYTSFRNCYLLEEVVIPEGVTTIGYPAFSHCSNIKNIVLPSTMTQIENNMFEFCTGLESVSIPEGITRIGKEAFLGCKNLTSITVPAGVEYIGENAFQGSGVTEIEIPEATKKVGSGLFTACEALVKLTVHNADMVIENEEGFNFAMLFSQCNPNLVVHGKPASTIAKQCARENILFEVMK